MNELARRYGLDEVAAGRLGELAAALAAEPDPPTTIRSPADVVDRHFADSLEALAVPGVREAGRIADIGAGAGFPGLVLAVALPAATVDLIESARRKCVVIERLAAAAGVGNARVLALRAEEWAAGEGRERCDLVTARALAALPVVLEYAAPLLAVEGVVVAWRGARDAAEEKAAAEAAALLGLDLLEVRRSAPFEGARDRYLHVYRKVKPTPDRFPRRAGMAAKRPLA